MYLNVVIYVVCIHIYKMQRGIEKKDTPLFIVKKVYVDEFLGHEASSMIHFVDTSV